jgi:ABC-2 type transport system permease protein
MTTSEAPRGEIYDLGYRRYEGRRLGRGYALWSLYGLSVRNAFGLGRGVLTKVLAFGLVLFALVPAVIQMVLAAVLPIGEFEFIQPHEYYGFIQVVLVLFVAAVASDLVGNDRRSHTLPLYFSRPIRRHDYALVKIAALTTGLLALTVAPQTLLFLGNWLGAPDGSAWLADNRGEILPILASGFLVSLFLASIGTLVATFASRRSFAIVSVITAMLLTFTVVQIVLSIVNDDVARWAILLSPIHVMRGATLTLFDAMPEVTPLSAEGSPDDQIARADLGAAMWLGVLLSYVAATASVTLGRYRGSV